MNFLVLSADGHVSIRPDSSRNKDNGDYYVPDGIASLGATPVVFARLCKTGKAIEEEFASRYYDAYSFGVFLYPDGNTIFDRTSVLPMPMYNPVTLENKGNIFRVRMDSEPFFECSTVGITERIHRAIVACSANTTIHKGDFVIAELDACREICTPSQGQRRIRLGFCENELLDITAKF